MKKLLYLLMLVGSLHMAVPTHAMEGTSMIDALAVPTPNMNVITSALAPRMASTVATAAASYGFDYFSRQWATGDVLQFVPVGRGTTQWESALSLDPELYIPFFFANAATSLWAATTIWE